MAYYRLYYLSRATGKIIRFDEIEAESDEEAEALACQKQGEYALELWCGRRQVAEIDAVIAGPAPAPTLDRISPSAA